MAKDAHGLTIEIFLNGILWVLRTGAAWQDMPDRSGLPIANYLESASPHKVTLVEATIASRFVAAKPERLIGDGAYDSDPFDAFLR